MKLATGGPDEPTRETGADPERERPSGTLGRVSFGFLLVTCLSGAALSPFWSAREPLASLESIEGGVPWGWALRAFHAFASFGLLVTTAGHLVQVLAARTEKRLGAAAWWSAVALLPIAVLALLGGFLMRGDAEAAAAAEVFSRVLSTIPAAGALLSRLLLGAPSVDPGTLALHHAGTFTLLLWLLTAAHGGRLAPDARSATLAALVSLALGLAVPLPLGPPPAGAGPAAGPLLGPWYLLGLQGALVSLPPVAGWLLPLLPVLATGLVRHAGEKARRLLLAALAAWALGWAAFSVRLLVAIGLPGAGR